MLFRSKGTAGYLPDLLSARVEFMFAPMANVIQHAQSGRMRALAVTSPTRASAMPELPTVMEEGVAGFQAVSWYMLLAPAKTPAATLDFLNREIRRALTSDDVKARYTREGAEIAPTSRPDASKFLEQEFALWKGVIQRANIRAE